MCHPPSTTHKRVPTKMRKRETTQSERAKMFTLTHRPPTSSSAGGENPRGKMAPPKWVEESRKTGKSATICVFFVNFCALKLHHKQETLQQKHHFRKIFRKSTPNQQNYEWISTKTRGWSASCVLPPLPPSSTWFHAMAKLCVEKWRWRPHCVTIL